MWIGGFQLSVELYVKRDFHISWSNAVFEASNNALFKSYQSKKLTEAVSETCYTQDLKKQLNPCSWT